MRVDRAGVARCGWMTALVLSLLVLPVWVLADEAEERGHAIAAKSFATMSGYGDFSARFHMIVKDNVKGKQRKRIARVTAIELPENRTRSLIIIEKPKDEQGTAFLNYSFDNKPDEQWLYIRATEKVVRVITGQGRSFLNSDLAYEDLGSPGLEKFVHRYLREESYDGRDTWVLERQSKLKGSSGYSKQVVWIDQERYVPLRMDFYGRGGNLAKTMYMENYQLLAEKYWRAMDVRIVNHQVNRETTLHWQDFKFNNGFTARQFDVVTLKRSHQ